MIKIIEKLHYITHTIPTAGHDLLAEQACQGGVKCVQLRMKDTPLGTVESTARKVLEICLRFNAALIINDYPEIAKAVGAAGVHLGKEDMNPVEARRLLGDDIIIGGSATDFDDIIRLADAKVDYIGLSPFAYTDTKNVPKPNLGVKGYLDMMEKCAATRINIPVIALGGITLKDVPPLMKTGIFGIAVSGAITHAPDRIAASRELIKSLTL